MVTSAASSTTSTVDTDFRVTYCQQLVTVPAGAGSPSISVDVAAK